MGATKISKGIYKYKGYRISNYGYYEPDHCVWWEAVDMQTGCADYHATTKKFLMEQIDDDLKKIKLSKTTFLLVVKVGEKNNRIREEILQAFNRRNVSLL